MLPLKLNRLVLINEYDICKTPRIPLDSLIHQMSIVTMDWQDGTVGISLIHKPEDLSSVPRPKSEKGESTPERYPLVPHMPCQTSTHIRTLK